MRSVACVVLAAVSVGMCAPILEAAPQRRAKPLVGPVEVIRRLDDSRPTLSIHVPVRNPGPGTLRAKVRVLSGKAQVKYGVAGFTAPAGVDAYFGIGEIAKRRTQPVRLSIAWQRGGASGTETYTVSPKDNSVVWKRSAPQRKR